MDVILLLCVRHTSRKETSNLGLSIHALLYMPDITWNHIHRLRSMNWLKSHILLAHSVVIVVIVILNVRIAVLCLSPQWTESFIRAQTVFV